MATFVRVLLIVLTAAFAAGTVAHASSATTMDLTMAFESADMGMPDCQDCPDDGNRLLSCDTVCVTPCVAVIPGVAAEAPVVESPIASSVVHQVFGRAGSPDPYPPKSIILS